MAFTSAGVCRSAVVESRQTGLAAASAGVVQALETFAAAAVAAARDAAADVSVAGAAPAGSAPHWVAVETLLTDVAAVT